MTQGLVTVRSGGRVVMKVIVGCDGYNARAVADRLQEDWPVTIDEAYEVAQDIGFGETQCLVVITEEDERYDGDDDLDPRYRETFQQPEFNPRWEHGTADLTIVIDV